MKSQNKSNSEKNDRSNNQSNNPLQWHPAFYASLQIELEEEADKLIFENEHQLGTKPKQIDVLIIKKNSKEQIHKNIGRIFREHNIVEYKSPDDYLSVDDFYKVYGYACFYKADAPREDSVPAEEITISFVSKSYPAKMMKHLQEVRGLDIIKGEEGIYYICNDIFLMQMIVTSKLSEETNLWLRSLTNNLRKTSIVEKLLYVYERHTRENNYKSAMNIIANANKELFREVGQVCEALKEIYSEILKDEMKDELDAREMKGVQQGVQKGALALIEMCKELNYTYEEILAKIIEKLNLTEEDAKEYMTMYM